MAKSVFAERGELLVLSCWLLVPSLKATYSTTNHQPTTNNQQPTTPKPDTGFRVFKLDSSNLKTWDATPTEDVDLFVQRMNDMIDTIKPDRSDMDMVYEIMLKMGVPLTYSVTTVEIGGRTIFSIGEDSLLLICLQENITTEIIEEMANDYLPSKIILSEKCFADDTAMSNAHYILKEREIELKLV